MSPIPTIPTWRWPGRQRGAALVTAVLLAGLVAVLASAMLWQQWSSLNQQSQARQSEQARWILRGAMDWARIILQENARNSPVDALDQPWATPLADTNLADFLAVRGADATALRQAWIAGRIRDAQSRFNLASLTRGGQPDAAAAASLLRLCAAFGVDANVVTQSVDALLAAQEGAGSALPLRQLSDLERQVPQLAQLESEVTLLPQPTPVNANTADATLLAAMLNIAPSAAAELVQTRNRLGFFRTTSDISQLLPQQPGGVDTTQLAVSSSFFLVISAVRLDDFNLAQIALIQRNAGTTRVLQVHKLAPWLAAAGPSPS